jgi:Protein of unknown function (DUF4238)
MGHHYVPQRYLKGFEALGNPGFIWTFDKMKESLRCLPIDKVAQSAGFYEKQVESDLANQVEGPGSDVIDKIRRGESITEEDRMHLTYYVATMIRRVPVAREKALNMVPQVLTDVAKRTRSLFEEAARFGTIDRVTLATKLAEVDAIEKKFQNHPPAPVLEKIETPWPFESMLLIIHSMYWRILRTDGPSYFLSSDNPAYFFYGMGLKHEECELTFPLCKEFLLHCAWQHCDEGHASAIPQSLVKEFNRRTASGAGRFIFYHDEASWIASVAKNRVDQLSRIRW